MTKAQRMILDAATRDAFQAAGEMCVAMDKWIRAMTHGEPARAGAEFTRMLEARARYDRAMVALTEARR